MRLFMLVLNLDPPATVEIHAEGATMTDMPTAKSTAANRKSYRAASAIERTTSGLCRHRGVGQSGVGTRRAASTF